MIEMDIFYSRNISLSLDLKIILRTPPAILGQFFANGHPNLVLAISALLSACVLTATLALLTLVIRKLGRLQSARDLGIAYAVVAVIYVFLSALPIPRAPC